MDSSEGWLSKNKSHLSPASDLETSLSLLFPDHYDPIYIERTYTLERTWVKPVCHRLEKMAQMLKVLSAHWENLDSVVSKHVVWLKLTPGNCIHSSGFLNKSTHVFIFSSIHTHTPERWGERDRQRERNRDRKIRGRETERDYVKTIKYFKKKVSMVVWKKIAPTGSGTIKR